jgi:hypothetical protein
MTTTKKKKKKTKKTKKVKIEKTELESHALDNTTTTSPEKKKKKTKMSTMTTTTEEKKTKKAKKAKKAQQRQADTRDSLRESGVVAVLDPTANGSTTKVDLVAAAYDDDTHMDGDIEQGIVGVGRTTEVVNLVKKSKDVKLGFTYVKKNDGKTTVIKTVAPGGLADHAGLEVGMKILTVNGQRAYDVDLGDLDAGTISFIIDRECDPDGTPVAVAVAVPQRHTKPHKQPVDSDDDDAARCGIRCPLMIIIIGVNVILFLSTFIGIAIIVIGISIWVCIAIKRRR